MDENLSETEPLLRKESKSSISSRPTTLSRQLSPVNTSVNRDPFVVNTRVLKKQGDGDSLDTLAQYSRYKYYSKLHKSVDNFVSTKHYSQILVCLL